VGTSGAERGDGDGEPEPQGAAVYAPFSAERGDFVLLRSTQFGLEVLAAVRACRTDERGVARPHLEFLDREWPLGGVE
jgi:hypothetical protein